jgi:hypothetical protein
MHHEDYGDHGFCGFHDARPHFHHRHDCSPHHHHGHGMRRFFTREEKIAHLEEYLKQLQAEIQGVEEYLAELRKCQ